MADDLTMTAPDWVHPKDVTHVGSGETAGAYTVRSDHTITHVAPAHVDDLKEHGFSEVVAPEDASAPKAKKG